MDRRNFFGVVFAGFATAILNPVAIISAPVEVESQTVVSSQIADMVESTLRNLGELRFKDIVAECQRTSVLKRLVSKKKISFGVGHGSQIGS